MAHNSNAGVFCIVFLEKTFPAGLVDIESRTAVHNVNQIRGKRSISLCQFTRTSVPFFGFSWGTGCAEAIRRTIHTVVSCHETFLININSYGAVIAVVVVTTEIYVAK